MPEYNILKSVRNPSLARDIPPTILSSKRPDLLLSKVENYVFH